MTIKKRLATAVMACAMAVSAVSAISANAKSLKNSFYSGTYVSYSSTCWWSSDYDYYTKSCYAGTSGYSGRHYVRAMIGSGAAENIWADTNRCYSNGDIERTATTGELLCYGFSWEFPTGYGYYGTT